MRKEKQGLSIQRLSFRAFLFELQRRKVTRAAAVYGAAGWSIIEIVDILAPAFKFPDWTLKMVVVLFLLGVPLILFKAWTFKFTHEESQREGETRIQADVGRDRSIVILPFVNWSADEENEYFSDGLTDELISDLAQIKLLRVISRTSSMQLKGTDKSVRRIGAELGVRYLLEGSVRRSGNSLRITAQLIDALIDSQIWAQKFNGSIDEIFDVQERVALAIVSELNVALTPLESERLRDRPIRNVRAFELYLKAREELGGFDVGRAVPLIERAVSIEGDVPALRALRAMTSLMLLRTGASHEPDLMNDVEREARALVAEAPDQAYGHSILGFLEQVRGEQFSAVISLRRAMELDPSDGDVHLFYGIAMLAADHPDPLSGLEWLARDPLSPLAQLLVATNSWFVGDQREGLAAMEEAVHLAPTGPIYHWSLGYHYALLQRLAEAEHEAAWLAEHAKQLPYTAQLGGLVAAIAGRNAEALEILTSVDEVDLDGHNTFHLAESYAMAGEHDRAIALLERAVTMGFYPWNYIANRCPFFATLRGRDEFARVATRAAQLSEMFQTALESVPL